MNSRQPLRFQFKHHMTYSDGIKGLAIRQSSHIFIMPPLRDSVKYFHRGKFFRYPMPIESFWYPFLRKNLSEPFSYTPNLTHPYMMYLDALEQALDLIVEPSGRLEPRLNKMWQYVSQDEYSAMMENYCFSEIVHHLDIDFISNAMKQMNGSIAWRVWTLMGKQFVRDILLKNYRPDFNFNLRDWIMIGTEVLRVIYALPMPDNFFQRPVRCMQCDEETFSPVEGPCELMYHESCLRDDTSSDEM